MWDIVFSRYTVFLLVFVRMSGMILFNPFFGRKSVPAIIKGGLALLISIPASMLVTADIEVTGILELMVFAIKELMIGFLIGFILNLFLSSVLIAGDMIDLQLGVGMAKIYDPQSGTNIAMSGSLLNLLFTVLFFISNGHLTFMKMTFYSFQVLPPGPGFLGEQAWSFAVSLFGSMLILALKIAMPMLCIEILAEAGLGILMRTVPQINVFAVGLQLKLIVGLVLFVFIIPALCGLFDSMTNEMFRRIEEGIILLAG